MYRQVNRYWLEWQQLRENFIIIITSTGNVRPHGPTIVCSNYIDFYAFDPMCDLSMVISIDFNFNFIEKSTTNGYYFILSTLCTDAITIILQCVEEPNTFDFTVLCINYETYKSGFSRFLFNFNVLSFRLAVQFCGN